ncbi:MAG: hypothetical protein ACU0CO_02395 [Shimia sp.]
MVEIESRALAATERRALVHVPAGLSTARAFRWRAIWRLMGLYAALIVGVALLAGIVLQGPRAEQTLARLPWLAAGLGVLLAVVAAREWRRAGAAYAALVERSWRKDYVTHITEIRLDLRAPCLRLPHAHGAWLLAAHPEGTALFDLPRDPADPRADLTRATEPAAEWTWQLLMPSGHLLGAAGGGPRVALRDLEVLDAAGLATAIVALGLTDVPEGMVIVPLPFADAVARLGALAG